MRDKVGLRMKVRIGALPLAVTLLFAVIFGAILRESVKAGHALPADPVFLACVTLFTEVSSFGILCMACSVLARGRTQGWPAGGRYALRTAALLAWISASALVLQTTLLFVPIALQELVVIVSCVAAIGVLLIITLSGIPE